MMVLSRAALFCLLISLPTSIRGHTWVEQVTQIASNGTFVGTPGYPRGFTQRAAGVDPDTPMTNLIPPNGRSTGNAILPTDLMCKSSQMIGVQTPGSPALTASPGDMVALRYQENGHVTQPQIPPGKPAGSGTVFVYGTTQPSNSDTFLGIHGVWNTNGTGGDGRGKLLATRPFDDGQCYQINGGPISQARQKEFQHQANSLMGSDLWCQTDFQIPTDITGNSLAVYWVWQWDTLAGSPGYPTGLNQSYTTCMDINLDQAGGQSKNAEVPAVNFASGQPLDNAAIAAQLSTAFLINPTASLQPFVSGSSTAGGATPATTPTTVATTSQAVGGLGFVTVTVTESAKPQIVTVTNTVEVPVATQVSAKSETSTATVVPLPASSATGTSTPAVQPFLSPQSSVGSATTPNPTVGHDRREAAYTVRGRVFA